MWCAIICSRFLYLGAIDGSSFNVAPEKPTSNSSDVVIVFASAVSTVKSNSSPFTSTVSLSPCDISLSKSPPLSRVIVFESSVPE